MQKSIHTPEYRALRVELVQARNDAGLSQREIASRLNVAPSWVAKVESGERRIDLVEFFWFLAACHADPMSPLQRVAGKAAKGGRK